MTTIPEHILDFFKNGFDNEDELVSAIKTYLLTTDQGTLMSTHDVLIHDILNGNVSGKGADVANYLFDKWNKKLGFECFEIM